MTQSELETIGNAIERQSRKISRLEQALETSVKALFQIATHQEYDSVHTTDCSDADGFIDCVNWAKDALSKIKEVKNENPS